MRILLLHEMWVLLLELVNNKDALWAIAELDEGLQDATAVMLVTKLLVFLTNGINALLDNGVLFLSRHFLFLHQKLIV